MNFETKCLYIENNIDTISGGINTPIFPSTSHDYLDISDPAYPRYFNTLNQKVIENKVSLLEGAEASVIFSSGMAAISTALLTFLHSGDHVIFQDEIYGGTHAFAENILKNTGVEKTFVDGKPKSFEMAIRPETKMIYIETPTNPLLSIIDIAEIAKIASQHKILVAIDNTFATPMFQNPIALGVDIVIHSGTKYFGGHSDLSCGAVATRKELADKIRKTALNFGGSINPLTCYLLERSMKTLAIRVQKQSENAFQIAKFLKTHTSISKVFYPGLESHPGHEIAKKQMSGYGAMLSFEIKQSSKTIDQFMKKLMHIKPALSLGGVESTICDPARTSHAKVSPETRQRLGISDNLLRLSVGIENSADLIEDLSNALKES